jgi:hypothetical protein
LIVKNVRAAAVLLAALALAGPARAQVYGQYTSAVTLPVDGHMFGGYINASENVTGGLAQLRLSFYPNLDFGFQGGLTRLENGPSSTLTTLRLGADLRWQVAHMSNGSPVDIALGGALGVETADHYKVLAVGPTGVASRGLGGPNAAIVPYGGLAILFISRDTFGEESTDLSIPLRLGMEARISQGFMATAELQLYVVDDFNDDVGFSVGVNLPF